VAAGRADVSDLDERQSVIAERPRHEPTVDDPELARGRLAEGEADRARTHQRGHPGVVRIADRDRPGPYPHLRLLVGIQRVVPVEVIRRQVQQRAGRGRDRRREVQLLTGQLDGEDVVRRIGEHGVDERLPDIADRDRSQASRAQHRLEHVHRRGLAVRTRHRQPGCRTGAPQLPGQLDLAPDRNAAGGRIGQKRVVRTQPGRCDDETDLTG
jgi:hypothetical protein